MPNTPLLLALFAGLAGTQPAAAQLTRTSRVGLKLGGSLAQYRGNDTRGGNGNLGGYCGGGVLNLPLGPVFSVQSELLYSQKGARSQSFVLPTNQYAYGDQRLAYLELPALVKLRSSVGLFVETGLTFSYLLSARLESNGQSVFENRDKFKPFELGYAAGAGFQADNGLLLGVRYCAGLTSLFRSGAYPGLYRDADIYTQTFQLYAGLLFRGRGTGGTE
ncbi:porin family protein [Hymenobacter properus]|uniref:PorT family protein n=1 Tax=Hymenobacter properus TaxID=2791026 RepID=A0A931BH69_9BACT|nr:porin family protein [Hymenobacter properus]MBF9142401.1 PorT family protein [Hymenobacter properus]MBR7721208.1 PorT family protein [Microvirga sp. SRT04]